MRHSTAQGYICRRYYCATDEDLDTAKSQHRHSQPSFSKLPGKMPELVPDVLQLVFRHLAGDNATLLNVSLTCRAWRSLALPVVFQIVDVSSHNNGRQPQHESSVRPLVYADYDGEFRPQNLVSRQRAFLRLVTDKPELARYVKSFTWTLIWLDNWWESNSDDDTLKEIDRQAWDVFGGMVNVTHLDLASLHHVDEDEYIRQNPAMLFPNVEDLRLLGWMSRGLVRAIITSLDPRKLRSLKSDYLEDEGALPNGESLGEDISIRYAHHASSGNPFKNWRPETNDGSEIYDDDLIIRQETGNAFVFPGPMWLPLYLLSTHAMVSLTHLQVKVAPFSRSVDVRAYNTLFRQTSSFITKTRETLKSLIIVFDEHPGLYLEGQLKGGCGTPSGHNPWCIKMAKLFLEQLLAALNENAFPQLEKIRFEGFHHLEDANAHSAARAGLASVLRSVRESESRFGNTTFTDIKSLSGRKNYHGHNGGPGDDGRFAELLAKS